MPTNRPMVTSERAPISMNTCVHGTMKMISRSNTMNWIAMR